MIFNQFTAIMTTHVVIENVMYCAIMTTHVVIVHVCKKLVNIQKGITPEQVKIS